MIGIFDSGVGGLTILKAIKKRLPKYSYIYLADSARAPYGDKKKKIIYKYTVKAVDFLFKQGCQLIILACNTASAVALRKIQKKYLPNNFPNRRVLGVVVPNLETISNYIYKSLYKRAAIGLIGTKATIKSRAYQKELNKICQKTKFFSKSCPRLVPLIERDSVIEKKETIHILNMYLGSLIKKRVKAVILACTHYSLLLKEMKKILGPEIKIIDTAKAIAEKTSDYLIRHPEIKVKLKKNGKIKFYTTGEKSDFKVKAEKILKRNIKVKKISI